MPGKRECENWLKSFLEWTEPVSMSPLSLLTWSGLFCISSVVKRKIQFSREYTKHYEIYPNAYTMFVGPPGVVTKSTSAGKAQQVMEKMNEGLTVTDPAFVNLGATSGSHIGIIERMKNTPDGSLSLVAGEFGNLVATTPNDTYEFLQKMFDSDATAKKFVHSTRAHGDEAILKPSLNLLGCTTPEWISGNAGYMLGAGFAARTVFIFEYHPRQRRLFYKDVGPSVKDLDALETKLAKDLKKIGNLKGEMKPENDELAKKMEAWFQNVDNFTGEVGTETFQVRKHVHVIRTAMLLSLVERDDLIVTEKHFNTSLALIADVESRLGRGLSSVGKNPYSAVIHELLDYIRVNGPIKRGKLMARFWRDFQGNPEQELEIVLDILRISGEIEEISNTRELRVMKQTQSTI